jgi:hypothetical protein
MCQLELFDGDFALIQPSTNFRFIGTFQPQFHRFFDHFFSVFWCFALTDDPEVRQFATYQPSSPGSITAVSFGRFIMSTLSHATVLANGGEAFRKQSNFQSSERFCEQFGYGLRTSEARNKSEC